MLYFLFACILMVQRKDVIITGGPYCSGSVIVDTSVQFRNDRTALNSSLAATGFHEN